MSRIRSDNTKPEKTVRSLLHKMGFRFSLRRKNLPGKPDIILPKYKLVIFVHGCFWHRHRSCIEASRPKSRSNYWEEKLSRNVARDKRRRRELRRLGWEVITLWECEIEKRPENIVTIFGALRRQNDNAQQARKVKLRLSLGG